MNNKPHIQLLITDLDNTLYNWVSSFVPAFYAMVDVAARILAVNKEQLLDEFKLVHQHYHNSEHPFALLEVPSVERKYPRATRLERKHLLDEAFWAFNRTRKKLLRLFPGVRETLQKIQASGCIIVGHTEAFLENSLYRLILLDLFNEIDLLYAPKSTAKGHPDPARQKSYDLYLNKVHLLPNGHRKPDPEVLKDICLEHGISLENTLYVGDSMTRDVAMAKAAGAIAVWARYGCNYDPADWDKLVRITHWTVEDVAREKHLHEVYHDVKPDYEIDSYTELLSYFEFDGKF